MPISQIKILFLSVILYLSLSAANAQSNNAGHSADSAKAVTDSVFVPLKYCDLHKRSPLLAGVLSICVPGAGQLYNKQPLKAGVVFGTFAASFFAAEIYYQNNKPHPHDAVTVALLTPMAAAYVYSIIDASVTANWLNRTYHLSKKMKSLTALQVRPVLISSTATRYIGCLSLVLR